MFNLLIKKVKRVNKKSKERVNKKVKMKFMDYLGTVFIYGIQ